ncbi:MAG: class I SAM-dependent methyltransferase [Nocardiopsaceae bacterium]|nr:class I SAM-dependent methyltransferase [Nocardiopsaceae bacterium]
MHDFDKAYWENHWARATGHTPGRELPVNPYLPAETQHLPVGTALDAGCGAGVEAVWLAQHGWQVTGADISAPALAAATSRTEQAGLAGQVEWVEADLTRWEPGRTWDLVVTNYAHPTIGQLAFYQRLASWVVPGGSMLIVGHLHAPHAGGDHPVEATVTRSGITGLFTGPGWQVDASYENTRTVDAGGRTVQLHDVIVRAHRRP